MNITPADWKLLFELLDSALDMDENKREAWMARLDGDALKLKGELRKLLAQHAKVDTAHFVNPYLSSAQSAAAQAVSNAGHPATPHGAPVHADATLVRLPPGQAAATQRAVSVGVRTGSSYASTRLAGGLDLHPDQWITPASLQVGSILKNRFVLVEEIGSGGMGRVFKARDRVPEAYDDRHPFLAIKVLSAEFSQYPDAFKALQREAKRGRGLTHENVVKVYDFDQDGGCVYMTMEYLDGRTLQSYLRDEYKKGLPLDKAWRIIRSIGVALEHGHEKRIVHSDLKPGNVFICRDGTVKVLDFGISRPFRLPEDNAEETLFDPSKRLGGLTPAYASLEMWSTDTPDPRDDVYAYACLTYELLAGVHPFGRCSAKDAVESSLRPQRIKSLRRSQWEMLKRGLALHRQDRVASAAELMEVFAPTNAFKIYGKYIVTAGAMASLAAVGIGAYYYRLAVEDSTLEMLQCASPPAPEPVIPDAPPEPLTAQRTQDIRDSLSLAQDYLHDAKPEMNVTDLRYILSEGANNVNQIAESVLTLDPANAEARQLKVRVTEVYASKAEALLAEGQIATALQLVRDGRKVLPSSQPLFRLEQTLCGAEGAARNGSPSLKR